MFVHQTMVYTISSYSRGWQPSYSRAMFVHQTMVPYHHIQEGGSPHVQELCLYIKQWYHIIIFKRVAALMFKSYVCTSNNGTISSYSRGWQPSCSRAMFVHQTMVPYHHIQEGGSPHVQELCLYIKQWYHIIIFKRVAALMFKSYVCTSNNGTISSYSREWQPPYSSGFAVRIVSFNERDIAHC